MNRVIKRVSPVSAISLALLLSACGDDPSTGSNNAAAADATGDLGAGGDVQFGDTQVADSAAGDSTGKPDAAGAQDTGAETTQDTSTGTDAADTGAVDTGAVDTGAADTGGDDTGAGGTDTAGADTTTGGTDAGSADTVADIAGDTGADTSSDADNSDAKTDTSADGGGTNPLSCAGRCGEYSASAACQCDSGCANFGDCCADLASVCGCVGDDCCTKDADCDDSLACTDDTCGKDSKCVIKVKPNSCAVDGKCYVKGEGPSNNACTSCDPAKSTVAFAPKTGTACDDGSPCTSADSCDDKGVCVAAPKANCCKVDGDCTSSEACKVGACDAKAGTCTYAAKANCCTEGVCCDQAAKAIKAAGASCGSVALAVEYQCDGAAAQKRQSYEGCDGVAAATCSKDAKFNSWTSWSTIQTCGDGQKCTLEAKDKPPICKADGGGKACTDAKGCDDGNPCTTDTCDAGKCQNATKASCCVFDSECNDGNACTVDSCNGDNTCGNTAKTCKAPSDCETAVCDATTGQCKATVKADSCKIGNTCVASGAKNPTDACLACAPSTSATDWSPAIACKCASGVCCDAKAGKILPGKTKCDDAVKATEYQCSADGKQLQQRQAFRGCTGTGNTCSATTANYAWTDWTKVQDCAAGTVCEVKDAAVKGTCVSVTVGICTPNTTCCDAKGQYAAKATSCGKDTIKTETKCSSADKGGKVQTRTAVAGCTGASTTCSTAASNLNWTVWKDTKTCASDEICQVKDGLAACQKVAACDPKLTCCTASGTFASQATKCGTELLGSQFQCSGEAKGAKVQKRDAYGGCSGTAIGCSFLFYDLHFTAWSDVKTCKATEYCSVDADGTPGCVVPPTVDCKAVDSWEGEEKTEAAKKIGSFKDSDPAKFLTPKPHLGSATDADFYTYDIADAANMTNPRVHIEWSAAGSVTVCAFYSCDKGKNGKECAPIICPSDSLTVSNPAASAVDGNGCCTQAYKGVIDFTVSAPGTLDESGKVYFDIYNDSPFCQNVDVKLAFGSNLKTVCDPGKTCCTDAGQWAAQGTTCGTTALKKEYQCAGAKAGDDVQVREAFAGCTGTSGVCSTVTANQVFGAWKTLTDCKAGELCSVPDKTKPGTCVGGNDAVCKATDKFEGPTSTAESYDLGSYKDGQNSVMVKPNVHLNGVDDKDWFKYRVTDDPNLNDPVVDVEWVSTDKVTVCAYYQCTTSTNGKDCYPVTCPAGSTAFSNSAVSDVTPNGCCMTGQYGLLSFSPDAPGFFNADETGWVYFNVKNAAPICQYAVVKLSFAGSTTACGDGVCEGSESSTCKTDCGSCDGKCGQPFSSGAACQCDSACGSIGDCCWDKPLVCGG